MKTPVTRRVSVTHADGLIQQLVRRLPSGNTVPIATVGRTWHGLIVPGRGATGGAAREPNHPSRKHDTTAHVTVTLTRSADVQGPVPGQPRRRERRAAARAARKPMAGGYCPCSGVTDFYTDDDRETWELQHASCDTEAVSA